MDEAFEFSRADVTGYPALKLIYKGHMVSAGLFLIGGMMGTCVHQEGAAVCEGNRTRFAHPCQPAVHGLSAGQSL